MDETTDFTIGSEVSCIDAPCGQLARIIVDPLARKLTHLVVESMHRRDTGRLVPIELVDTTAKDAPVEEIRLRCTTAEFDALEDAEQTQFLPGATGQWGYRQEHMLSWPYYGLDIGGMGMGGTGGAALGPQEVSYDRVPVGDVEVRRGEHVHATDGSIGRVQGLVIDPSDHRVTHVLLDEGHLWGKKRVAIPINAVAGVDDGVRLNLTKDEVRELPEIDLDDQR